MKYFRFIPMLLLAATLAFTACYDDGGDKTYSIGDTGPSGVGIVFYVTDGGLHGFEVAPVDQSSSVWIEGGPTQETLNGNTLTDRGSGSDNTDAIIEQTGHTGSAALICSNYRAAEEGDWFLPSKEELWEIWWNLVSDQSADNNGRGKPYAGSLGGFVGDCYWSSSEFSFELAWLQDFWNGAIGANVKDLNYRVRAVRAF